MTVRFHRFISVCFAVLACALFLNETAWGSTASDTPAVQDAILKHIPADVTFVLAAQWDAAAANCCDSVLKAAELETLIPRDALRSNYKALARTLAQQNINLDNVLNRAYFIGTTRQNGLSAAILIPTTLKASVLADALNPEHKRASFGSYTAEEVTFPMLSTRQCVQLDDSTLVIVCNESDFNWVTSAGARLSPDSVLVKRLTPFTAPNGFSAAFVEQTTAFASSGFVSGSFEQNNFKVNGRFVTNGNGLDLAKSVNQTLALVLSELCANAKERQKVLNAFKVNGEKNLLTLSFDVDKETLNLLIKLRQLTKGK